VRVARVSLRDFRNYERAELDLGERLTVVHGPNGAGKTNLLEAVYFACTGRSCRTSNEREVVRHGAQVTRVTATVADDEGSHALEVGFQPGEPKRMRVDGASVERLAGSGARPLVSVFLPDRLELVKGAPALRRGHLDQFVAAMWPARAGTRSSYSRALAQRNALISRVRAGAAAPSLLDAWDAELARHGVALMADRRAAADLIAPAFARRAADLDLPERAELRYRPRSQAGDEAGLKAELHERRDDDLRRGFSGHGPHRDDLVLTHAARSLRSYGSQGQQRVALLALLFAERDALVERDRPPLMLLDDVMSELDAARRERLADLVREGGQAVITATELDHVPGAHESGVATAGVRAGTIAADHAEVRA
jgi:DNA replication and repair protein RecF